VAEHPREHGGVVAVVGGGSCFASSTHGASFAIREPAGNCRSAAHYSRRRSRCCPEKQAEVIFGRAILSTPDLYVLCEPTRGVEWASLGDLPPIARSRAMVRRSWSRAGRGRPFRRVRPGDARR